MVRVVVCSKNPVKISAVKEAFQGYFESIEINSVKVDSFAQPFDKQIVEGARARARTGLKDNSDFAVGLEGGILEIYGVPYLTAFCSVINNKGEEHGGWGPLIELPNTILNKIKKEGKELGDVMDEIHNRKNVKQQEGTMGILTKGRISRKDALKQAVILAIARFL